MARIWPSILPLLRPHDRPRLMDRAAAAPLAVEKVESGPFVGMRLADRVLLFNASGNRTAQPGSLLQPIEASIRFACLKPRPDRLACSGCRIDSVIQYRGAGPSEGKPRACVPRLQWQGEFRQAGNGFGVRQRRCSDRRH